MNRILVIASAIGIGVGLHAFAQQMSSVPQGLSVVDSALPSGSAQQLPEDSTLPEADHEMGSPSPAPQQFGSPSSAPQQLPELSPPDEALSPPDADSGSPSSGWSYTPRGTDVLWVSSRNDHGSLGQYCNTEMRFCVWLLMLRGVACAEGGEHPVLLNTDRLATSQILRCVGTTAGRGATFAFTNFEDIDNAIRSAEQLAIAIPEAGDNIVVTHFPLAGAVSVLDHMRRVLAERHFSDDDRSPAGSHHQNPRDKTPPRNEASTSLRNTV